MKITAHLNFFSIDECGLYKHGETVPKALGVDETFELIYQWVQGKPMEDTIPWEPSSKSGKSQCYCHDFYKCDVTGEFFFVLWKSEADSVGTIWGAQASAKTGSSNVVEYTDGYKGKKVIWGRPCYYWIIPKLNTVVSIKTDNSVCDSGLFQDWVTKCINNRVHHKNKIKTETDSGQIRYEYLDENGVLGPRYAYRFDVHLRSLNTGTSELKSLASRVTHVIRRDTIALNNGFDERPEWIKIFDKIPLLPVKPMAKTRQIEVRAEAKPTAAELKIIIEQFAKEHRKRSEWNNVGFETTTGTVWVDRYRLQSSVWFEKSGDSVFPAADMHGRLSELRGQILKEVVADEAVNKKMKKAAKGGA